jgi:hypothetical protein
LSLVGSSSHQVSNHNPRHRLSNYHNNSFLIYRVIHLLNNNHHHPSLCSHSNKVICNRWEFNVAVT